MPCVAWVDIPDLIRKRVQFEHSSVRGSWYGQNEYRVTCKGRLIARIKDNNELKEIIRPENGEKADNRVYKIICDLFNIQE